MLERRSDIQGLRAIAILLVVAYHGQLPIPGGFIGVDVFFVISGFVITRLLLREIDGSGRIDLRRFYARRARRLLPALVTLIVIVMLVCVAIESPLGSLQLAARTAAGAALFVANMVLFLEPSGYFAAPAALNPFLHTWSLSVEEQFYLIFPGLLALSVFLAARRGEGRRRWMFGLLSIVSVGSFALAIFLTTTDGLPFHGHNAAFSFYSSPTRVWEFGIGALLAMAEHRIAGWDRRIASPAAVLGVAGVAYGAVAINADQPFPSWSATIPVLGTGLLILAGTLPTRQPINGLLATRPMQWIGDLSYSWYLWHWPAIVLIGVVAGPTAHWAPPAAGLASLVPAWLSKRFVEDPVRTGARFGRMRALVLATTCVGVSLSLCAATFVVAQVATPAVRDARAQRVDHVGVDRNCTANLPTDANTYSNCTWPAGSRIDGRTIVLIGDSNAGQFAESVLPIAQQQDRSVVLATHSACPFVDVVLDPAPAGCQDFVRAWVDELVRSRPAMVIMASASADYFIPDQHVKFRAPGDTRWYEDDTNKSRLYRDGTASVLRQLSAANIPVLLIPTLPHFVDWDLYNCPGYTVWRDVTACGRSTPLSVIDAQQRAATDAERAAAAGISSVTTVDLRSELCPDGICRTNDGNRWINRDGGHITVGEAERLVPTFTRLITDRLPAEQPS